MQLWHSTFHFGDNLPHEESGCVSKGYSRGCASSAKRTVSGDRLRMDMRIWEVMCIKLTAWRALPGAFRKTTRIPSRHASRIVGYDKLEMRIPWIIMLTSHDIRSSAPRRLGLRVLQGVRPGHIAMLTVRGTASGDCATSDLRMPSRYVLGTGKRAQKHNGHTSATAPCRRSSHVQGETGATTHNSRLDAAMGGRH